MYNCVLKIYCKYSPLEGGLGRYVRGQIKNMLTQGKILREKRLALGISQADLARRLDVSAAYLNLIEHDRRRIGAALKGAIYRELGLDVDTMGRGGPDGVVDQMLLAASQIGKTASPPLAQELAVRYPQWADVIRAQFQHTQQLEEQVARLQDRIGHDMRLEDALHEVLSKVTSIRSMAAILGGSEEVSREWLQRFHRNIDEDGRQLAASAQALAEYLTEVEHADPDLQFKDAAWFWRKMRYYVPHIEEPQIDIPAVLDDAQIQDRDARFEIERVLHILHGDAQALPQRAFMDRYVHSPQDILDLVAAYRVSPAIVLRRVALHPSQAHSGLVMLDNKGEPIFVKPLNNFDLQLSQDHLCARWPIYDAGLAETGFNEVNFSLHGAPLGRYIAQCAAQRYYSEGRAAHMRVMRVLQRREEDPAARDIGLRCRLCFKAACADRAVPAFDR